jgi:hypothetical protein
VSVLSVQNLLFQKNEENPALFSSLSIYSGFFLPLVSDWTFRVTSRNGKTQSKATVTKNNRASIHQASCQRPSAQQHIINYNSARLLKDSLSQNRVLLYR